MAYTPKTGDAADLLFQLRGGAPYVPASGGGATLLFGDIKQPPPAEVLGVMSIRFKPLQLIATGEYLGIGITHGVQAAIHLPRVQPALNCKYDGRTVRYSLSSGTSFDWSGSERQTVISAMDWDDSPPLEVGVAADWGSGPKMGGSVEAAWGQLGDMEPDVLIPWGVFSDNFTEATSGWDSVLEDLELEPLLPWGTVGGIFTSVQSSFIDMLGKNEITRVLPWGVVGIVERLLAMPTVAVKGSTYLTLVPWGIGTRLLSGSPPYIDPPIPPKPPGPYRGSPTLLFSCLRDYLFELGGPLFPLPGSKFRTPLNVPLIFGLLRCGQSANHLIPLLKVYVIMNNLTAVSLLDGLPITIDSLNIQTDTDSFTWGMKAQIPGSELHRVDPSEHGTYVPIKITANGEEFVMHVTSYDPHAIKFNDRTVGINAQSPSILLSSPGSEARNYIYSDPMRAAQIVQAEILRSGLSSLELDWGVAVDFDAAGWLVPGGSFGYTAKSPKEVISDLVKPTGSYVQTSKDGTTLMVRSKYPIAPWNWESAPEEYEIPYQYLDSISASFTPGREYDGIYVSGINYGVTALVRRQFSSGTILKMPEIVEGMLVDAISTQERGKVELSETGPSSLVTMVMPVKPEYGGLISVGSIVKVVPDDRPAWKGMVRSVQLTAQPGPPVVISQSITVERRYL